ncbi:MAG: terminase gpA endonuclease subunit, partial [Xanthobacteraceae bacterium]
GRRKRAMKVRLKHSLLSIVAGGLAALIEPAAPIAPSQWAAENVVLPDGEYAGQKIDLTRTPHIIEPLDLLGPDSPANEVGIMKCGQSGFTTMLQCAIGHSIDRDPCDMMVVQPTDGALTDFNSTKLVRLIEKTPVLARKVYPQTSRSSAGSTTYEKKFPGGALNLTLASSPAQLRLKTIKRAFCDEVDEYEDDLEGQGDPLKLIAGRQMSFLMSGTWKRSYISTPTVKGASKIETIFERGDQRRWHVECPHCRERIVLEWHAPFDPSSHGLKFRKEYPHQAHYVAPCCGGVIEGWQKLEVYRTGRWIATAPGLGRFPTYHFDALASPFVPWDAIAKEYIDAGDDPAKLKAFWNLYLGLPFDVTGDAPDHELLMQRREDYKPGRVPAGALLLTAFADVQMRGIYVEVVAWSPDQQSWTIHADYLEGATTEVDSGAFAELTALCYERKWPDAFGNTWALDQIGIDSGYRTDVVYEWTRRHPGAKATKGVDGWGKVPLGVATDQDVSYSGRKIKGGAKLRAIGTWPLKSKFYTYSALSPIVQGSALLYPPGYCRFGVFLDENYFKQITSEFLEDEVYRGRPRKTWKRRGSRENHFLDCRIGNSALANAYFVSFTTDEWALRAKERGLPQDMQAPDLFAVKEFTAASVAAAVPAAPEPLAAPLSGIDETARVAAGLAGAQKAASSPVERAPSSRYSRRVVRSSFMDRS